MLTGSSDFGGGSMSPTGDEDIFLAKFTSEGTYVWAKHFGVASNFAFFRHAEFDSSGDLYVVGNAGVTDLDLGCGALPSGSAIFLAKFDSSGACIWSKSPSQTDTTELGTSLGLDASGNVLIGGGFYGTVNFGNTPLTAPGSGMNTFIADFGPTGTLLWAKSFGSGASLAAVTGIGSDACNNIFVDGSFSGTIDFGCGTLSENGDTGAGDIFLERRSV